MRSSILARTVICLAAASLTTCGFQVFAQQPQPPADQADVIRINTELVQTGVVVLDKQGHFVEGLKPEQFQLRIDGKPVQFSFFERVVAGSANEAKLEAAASRGAKVPASSEPIDASYRGRTVIFFIDDLHLSAESVGHTRDAILEFIEKQMGPEDQVLIASASNQIGFLQKFTDLKAVARAAIGRLNYRPYVIHDSESLKMTEYSALRVDAGDKDAINYYADELLKATTFRSAGGSNGPPRGGGPVGTPSTSSQTVSITRELAERNVKERAQFMLSQASSITTNTLSTLESLMRSLDQMSGRKLVFFISDGFYLNDRNTAFGEKLKQITDAAVRSGVVIYSMDARGIVSMTDVTNNRSDGQGRLARANIGELSASQDPLTALAGDTGGRALLNSGALSDAVTNALRETANYYLLAWRPPTDELKAKDFKRIEVSITDHPELTVRLPRGFMVRDPKAAAKADDTTAQATKPLTPAVPKAEAKLMAALSASSARKGLPTQLSLSFVDVPGNGPVLSSSIQIATDVLGYGEDNKQAAAIDVGGVVFDDQGKPAGSFKRQLNVKPLAADVKKGETPGVIYTYKLPLKPGIYQVRVAAVDDKSGLSGSAAQWVEIPDLAAKRLTLSSLLVGGQFIGSGQQQAAGSSAEQVQFSVDRRFPHGSHMNFMTIIYNAAGTASATPNLEAEIKISRNGRAVVTSPLRKVAMDANSDLARIPYGADIALQTMPAGRYLLQVTIQDHVAKTSASQQIMFEIE